VLGLSRQSSALRQTAPAPGSGSKAAEPTAAKCAARDAAPMRVLRIGPPRTEGEAALWSPGEEHASGSEAGMTVCVVESAVDPTGSGQ